MLVGFGSGGACLGSGGLHLLPGVVGTGGLSASVGDLAGGLGLDRFDLRGCRFAVSGAVKLGG